MEIEWRLAGSLEALRKQINQAWPNRSKASDGSIGDSAHAARNSDHNPDRYGVVNAIDITNDPETGPAGELLAESLRLSRDARIRYVIFNHRMFSSYESQGVPAWTWREYTGANAHEHHVHISVWEQSEWQIR